MERLLQHPILEGTLEQYKMIRQHAGLDDDHKLQECIEAIEEWSKKQDHLIGAFQYVDRHLLENFLVIHNKGSVEATKIKIEKCLTLRGLAPELCANRCVEEYEKFSESIFLVPLPKLCSDLSRITLVQPTGNGWKDSTCSTLLRTIFMIAEYRGYCDYCLGERCIIDLKGINISFVTRINPLILKKAEIIGAGYKLKIKGIHFLNAPPFIDKIVSILKQIVKEKVASRIHVHNTHEELHEHVPKEILPVEYGGEALSCKELNEKWINCLKTEEARRFMDSCNNLVADESKRSEVEFNEEYLGMPGSFRRLTID